MTIEVGKKYRHSLGLICTVLFIDEGIVGYCYNSEHPYKTSVHVFTERFTPVTPLEQML